MTVASVLSHLVVRPQLFYKINENKRKRKINIDLAIVASQMPGGAIHDKKDLCGNSTKLCIGQYKEPMIGPKI